MVLALEDNPPELSLPDISAIPGPWCVVRTKSRCEKALARYLLDNNINYFLPYVATRTPSSGNLALSPMFSSFLFMAFPSQNRYELDLAKSSRHVFSYLHTGDQPRLKGELAFLAAETATTRTLKLERSLPKAGDRVRFMAGCYQGLEGIIAEPAHPQKEQTPPSSDPSRLRVHVMLELMGQPVSRVVDMSEIERVSDAV